MSPRARLLGLALFCIASAPAIVSGAVLTVEDVLRLHTAGVSEEIIISEIIVTETVFELSVEDLLRLQSAGLSDRLIQFMVDTGLPAEDRASPDEGSVTVDGGGSWINVIEEDPEPEVTYNVSLDYRYPYWWYDHYWYDYWYYDCHYAPYHSNWSFSIGVWYPGWYTWGGVYSWPACGYRDYCWGGYGYPYYGYPYAACHYYPTYYYPGHPSGGHYALSTVKYKTNGGSQVAASRSRDLGLQMRDGRAVTGKAADLDRPRSKTRVPTQLAHAGATVDQPVRSGRSKAHADAPTLDRKTRRPSSGAVVTETRRTRSATPVRAVRSPATDAQPPKKVHTVRRTTGVTPSAKSGASVEAPATRVKSSAPATRGTTVVRSAPTRSAAAKGSVPRASSGASRGVSRATRSFGGKGR